MVWIIAHIMNNERRKHIVTHNIVGKWNHKSKYSNITYEFFNDGSYTLKSNNDSISGKYQQSGNLISVSHRADMQFLIKSNQLYLTYGDGKIVTNSDGSNVTYKRI